MKNSHTILEVKNLVKKYSNKNIINNLSFSVKSGEIIGLLGPNGAGKTTAFYITIGLIKPDGGTITFLNEDITNKPVHERAKRGLGYLPQESSVFRDLTVEENILCILETLNISKKEKYIKLKNLLDELNLYPLRSKKASVLSGGERRRLEITRSLIISPSLLLLDEPFANIDPITINDVKKIIKHLKKKNISILITDHNAREIAEIADRGYLIQKGKVIISGKMIELINNKYAIDTYFGENFNK